MKLKEFAYAELTMLTSTPESKQAVIKLRELQDAVRDGDDPSGFKSYGCDGFVMTIEGIKEVPSTSADALFIASYGNDGEDRGYTCTTSTALPSSSADAPEPVQIDRLTQLRLENEALRLVVKSGITVGLPETPEDFDASIASMQEAVFKMKVHRGLREEGYLVCVATYNLHCFTKVMPNTGLTVLQFKKEMLKDLVGIAPIKPDEKFDFACIPCTGARHTEIEDDYFHDTLTNNRLQTGTALREWKRWVVKVSLKSDTAPVPQVEGEPQSPRIAVEDDQFIDQILVLSDIYPDLVQCVMDYPDYIHDAGDFNQDCFIKVKVYESKHKHVFDLDVPIT